MRTGCHRTNVGPVEVTARPPTAPPPDSLQAPPHGAPRTGADGRVRRDGEHPAARRLGRGDAGGRVLDGQTCRGVHPQGPGGGEVGVGGGFAPRSLALGDRRTESVGAQRLQYRVHHRPRRRRDERRRDARLLEQIEECEGAGEWSGFTLDGRKEAGFEVRREGLRVAVAGQGQEAGGGFGGRAAQDVEEVVGADPGHGLAHRAQPQRLGVDERPVHVEEHGVRGGGERAAVEGPVPVRVPAECGEHLGRDIGMP